MENKCKSCGIILDILCTNPACTGHQNESIGGICYYCATNQREKSLHIRNAQSLISSSLSDVDIDSEDA
jgi:hypothetical protein